MVIKGRLGLILVGLWVIFSAILTFVPALSGLGLLMAVVGVVGGICMVAGW